jgi:phage tail sheath protein FI
MGAVNQPMQVFSLSEFELNFGGVSPCTELRCAMRQFFSNGGSDAWVVRAPDSGSEADWLAGIKALDAVALFNLLVLPGMTNPAVINAAVECCVQRRAFLILDSPSNAKTVAQIQEWAESGAVSRSANAAVYFPWLEIADPSGGLVPRLSPPSGTIAGVYARLDANRGIWKAPAGAEATLEGVQGLICTLTDAENGQLNSSGINCLRTFPVYGPVVWGARTLEGNDAGSSQWKYVSVRRFALFLEQSLYSGTQWAVFEPNGEPLWSQLRLNVGAFMLNLFRLGAFQGTTPRDAWFVKCDQETTTQNDINNGKVNIVVGFAPVKPAEFIIIQIQQVAGQC